MKFGGRKMKEGNEDGVSGESRKRGQLSDLEGMAGVVPSNME